MAKVDTRAAELKAGSYNDPAMYHAPNKGIFRLLPRVLIPYAELMRLDRPSGYYAFYWHYAIGLSYAACIASPSPTPISLINNAAYLALWVVVLRGAVCTWNDNLDQEFDRKVARTRFRPIARGAVSTIQGHIFTIVQTLICGLMLLPYPSAVSLHAAIMTATLTIYPLGKRVTDFPQVILGVGFAIPVFMCCAALGFDPLTQVESFNELSLVEVRWSMSCLYGSSVLWTIIFDTVYAHQDIKDDVKAGVKSLAVRLGDRTKPVLGLFGVVQIFFLLGAGLFGHMSVAYIMLSCGGTAFSLSAMLLFVDLRSPSSCAWWFGPGSRLVGVSIVAGLLAEYSLRLRASLSL